MLFGDSAKIEKQKKNYVRENLKNLKNNLFFAALKNNLKILKSKEINLGII